MNWRDWAKGFRDYIDFNSNNQYTSVVEKEDNIIIFKEDSSAGNYDRTAQLSEVRDAIIENDTPASAADTGTKGDIKWDENYIYICVDTDTWKRAAISTW